MFSCPYFLNVGGHEEIFGDSRWTAAEEEAVL
jgi:hypothetical protein